LIRRLHAAGAELVGFNIFFSAPSPWKTPKWPPPCAKAARWCWQNYLRLKHLQGDAYVESLEEPPGVIAQSALATAPFLLAQDEEADRFLARYGESGDHPTFPLALLRLFVMKKLAGELDGVLRESGPPAGNTPAPSLQQAELAAFFAGLENWLELQPESRGPASPAFAGASLAPGQKAPLRSLIETLTGENTRYFNHYGRPAPSPASPTIACSRHRTAGKNRPARQNRAGRV